MSVPAAQTLVRTIRPNGGRILSPAPETQTLGNRDRKEAYADFVWALALKFADSVEEAELAYREMYADIRRHAVRGSEQQIDEHRLTSRIAFRLLVKYLQ